MSNIGTELQMILDKIAMMSFGMTTAEAHLCGVCINCKRPLDIDQLSDDARKEYIISALCPDCGNLDEED